MLPTWWRDRDGSALDERARPSMLTADLQCPPSGEDGAAMAATIAVLDRLARLAAATLAAPLVAVVLAPDGEMILAGAHGVAERWAALRTTPVSRSLSAEVLRTGDVVQVDDARFERAGGDGAVPLVGSFLGVPVRVGDGPTLGVVSAADTGARCWEPSDRTALEDVAAVAAALVGRWSTDTPARAGPAGAVDAVARQRRLARAEERWRAVFHHAPVAMAELSLEGRILNANPALAALAGRPAGELVGRPVTDIYHPDDAERSAESLARLKRSGDTVERVERRIVRPDGGLVWVAVRAAKVHPDADGEPVVLLHLMDITAERAHRLAIEELSARFAALVEHGSDPILLLDGDLVVRYASPAYRRVVGLPPGVALGKPIQHRVHPDDADTLRSLLFELTSHADDVITCEIRLAHASEGWRHVEVTAANHLEDPAIAGLVCTYRDVTGRVEAADHLAYQATHDPLTGLANRSLLLDHLELAIGRSGRSGAACAVFFIDLDDFKDVNDSLGHAVGDELLLAVAEQLTAATRPHDTVARLGGDEFVVLMEDVSSRVEALALAERLRRAVAAASTADGGAAARCSVGVALHDPADPRPLLERADRALYVAKTQGRDRCSLA